jgi:hypothetical protein
MSGRYWWRRRTEQGIKETALSTIARWIFREHNAILSSPGLGSVVGVCHFFDAGETFCVVYLCCFEGSKKGSVTRWSNLFSESCIRWDWRIECALFSALWSGREEMMENWRAPEPRQNLKESDRSWGSIVWISPVVASPFQNITCYRSY